MLLIQRAWDPHRHAWALPGGHVDRGETARQAAVRELAEETGIHIDPDDLHEIGVYDEPDRDPRGRYVTVAFTATVTEPVEPTAGDDAAQARWVDAALDDLAVAFDHRTIITDAITTARLTAATHR